MNDLETRTEVLDKFIAYALERAVNDSVYGESLKYEAFQSMRGRLSWDINDTYLDNMAISLMKKASGLPLSLDLNDEIQDFLYRLENSDEPYEKNKKYFIHQSFNLIVNHFEPRYKEFIRPLIQAFLFANDVVVDEELSSIQKGSVILDYNYGEVIERLCTNTKWMWLDDFISLLAGIIFCSSIIKSPKLVYIGIPIEEEEGKYVKKDKYANFKFEDIFESDGEKIMLELTSRYFNETCKKKEKLFWTVFLCVCYERNILKELPNYVYVRLINSTFNQEYKANNITTFTHFKRGDWVYPKDIYDFTFI